MRTGAQAIARRLFASLPPGFIRDSAHQYGVMVGVIVGEFLFTAVLARGLGPRDFGLVVMFLSVARICQGITDLRVHEFVIRYAEHARAAGDKNALARTLRKGLALDLLSTLAGLVLAIGFALIAPQLLRGGVEHRDLLLWAACASTAAWGGRYWSLGVFRLFHRVDLQARVQLGGSFGKLILTAAWFVILGASAKAGLVIATVWGGLASATLVLAAVHVGRKEVAKLGDSAPTETLWSDSHVFLASNYLVGLLDTAYRELDVQLVGWLGTYEQVSIYKLAKTFAGAVLQIVDPVVILLMPQFARDLAAKRFAELRRFIAQLTAVFTTVGLVVGVASHFIVPWLLPRIIGTQYTPVGGVFRIIVWCVVVSMPLLWTHPLCIALGRPQLFLAASVGGVATLAGLSYLLVPAIGAAGAGWAYGAALNMVAILTVILLALAFRQFNEQRTAQG
ncbi:MAG TPA: lipopolysaccharide biosynthesis protein [Thermoanaerobaculia bacterium]|nr:lipopolysaccharide biosynthesis protein [Thermoanaerobaculia bacterium]